jgi:hypothetical protein
MLTEDELAAEALRDDWTIRPMLVRDWDEDTEGEGGGYSRRLVPVTTPERAEMAEQFARHFHDEAGFDGLQFRAGMESESNRHVYLLNSRAILRAVPVAVGAVEVKVARDGSPVLTWVWLHPFERSSTWKVWERVWRELSELHGDLYIQAPLRPAMEAFRRRIGVPDERIVQLVPGGG